MILGLEVFLPLILVGTVVMGIVAVGSRRDLDPAGARSHALYLSGVCFITLFIVVFSLFGLISKAVSVPFDGGPSSSTNLCSSNDVPGCTEISFQNLSGFERNSDITSAVTSLIIGIFAAVAFVLHSRRLRGIANRPDFATSGAARTYASVLYATCFVSVFVAIGGAASGVIGLYRAAAPGVAQVIGGGRSDGFVEFIGGSAIAAAGIFIYMRASKLAAIARQQIAGGSEAPPDGGPLTA